MKILYVTQHYLPEMGALPGRVSEMARAWVEAGHEVHVLSPVPNHPTGVIPSEFRGRALFRETDPYGIHATRTWIYTAPNKGKVRRSVAFGSFLAAGSLAGIFALPRFDVVIGSSPQPLAAFAGFLIAKAKGAKFVLEVRDLWPESIVSVGALTEDHPIVRGLAFAMRRLYRSADHIVVVTEAFVEELSKQGVSRGKMTNVPNGVDLSRFRPVEATPADRTFLGGDATRIVSYMGTHGMAHDLGRLLDVASRFSQEERVAFAFIGDGAERKKLEAIAEERKLSHVRFLGIQPRERMPSLYAATDLCVVPLRKDDLFKTVLPSKIFEIMGMCKPMVLAVDGEARKLVERAGAGLFVPPGDTDALEKAIRTLLEDTARLKQMGANGRQFVEREFDRETLAKRYLHTLETL